MTRRCRRGLTLIELLASVVMLAAMAAACVPVLQRANELLRGVEGGDVDPVELGLVVDELVGDATAELLDGTELLWPDAASSPPIVARALYARDADATHDWVVFEAGGAAVYRWVERPEIEETTP